MFLCGSACIKKKAGRKVIWPVFVGSRAGGRKREKGRLTKQEEGEKPENRNL